MSIEKSVETSENLFSFPQIEPEPNADNTFMSCQFLPRENGNADSTDSAFELLAEILD